MPNCKHTDCNRRHYAKGWCKLHYERLRRNGALEAVLPHGSLADRFWSKVEKRGPEECWRWLGALDRGGYGHISGGADFGHRSMPAYRASYYLANGDLPKGRKTVIMHLCDNPQCVNPAHLKAGSQKQNAQHMVASGRDADTRGEKNGCAKMTDEMVIELRAGKLSIQQVVGLTGCSRNAAWMAKTGKTWKHIK